MYTRRNGFLSTGLGRVVQCLLLMAASASLGGALVLIAQMSSEG